MWTLLALRDSVQNFPGADLLLWGGDRRQRAEGLQGHPALAVRPIPVSPARRFRALPVIPLTFVEGIQGNRPKTSKFGQGSLMVTGINWD